MANRQFSLFIGDLDDKIAEDDLINFFQQKLLANCPTNIKICRTHNFPYSSLHYGYLNFKDHQDAEKCLDTLNYSSIFPNAKPFRLAWCQPDPAQRKSGAGNICVKNLPPTYQTKQLHDLFSDIGNIMSCRVSEYRNPKCGAHGYVQYQGKDQAEKAIEKHNGKEIDGYTIVVELARPISDYVHKTVYITGFPVSVTEEQLGAKLGAYGKVTKSAIFTSRDGSGRKLGFVWFEEQKEMEKCVTELNGKEITFEVPNPDAEKNQSSSSSTSTKQETVTVTVAIARSKAERMRYKRQLKEKTRFRNLYVRNFPPHFDHSDLATLFKKFGTITSCRVMKNDAGISRGFGFCCFSADEEARRAYLEMNGVRIPAIPVNEGEERRREDERFLELYVNYSQTREERRSAQLQKQNFAGQSGGMFGPRGFQQMGNRGPMPFYNASGAGMRFGQGGPGMFSVPYPGMGPNMQRAPFLSSPSAAPTSASPQSNSPNTGPTSPASSASSPNTAPTPPNMAFGVPGYFPYAFPPQGGRGGPFGQPKRMAPGPMGMPGFYPGPMYQPYGPGVPMPPNAPMRFSPGAHPGVGSPGSAGGVSSPPSSAMPGVAGYPGMPVPPGVPGYPMQQSPGVVGGSPAHTGIGGSPLPGVGVSPTINATGSVSPAAGTRSPAASGPSPAAVSGPDSTTSPSPSGAVSSTASSTTISSSDSPPLQPRTLSPVTIDTRQLAQMGEDEQKQYLGEALFQQIQRVDNQNPGKITGMLLELETAELIRLLEDTGELRAKVKEAQQVLDEAQRTGQVVD